MIWELNSKLYPTETGCENGLWMKVAQDSVKRRDMVLQVLQDVKPRELEG
jgi:hypothetical protein